MKYKIIIEKEDVENQDPMMNPRCFNRVFEAEIDCDDAIELLTHAYDIKERKGNNK